LGQQQRVENLARQQKVVNYPTTLALVLKWITGIHSIYFGKITTTHIAI
jgi:hypothetical protein